MQTAMRTEFLGASLKSGPAMRAAPAAKPVAVQAFFKKAEKAVAPAKGKATQASPDPPASHPPIQDRAPITSLFAHIVMSLYASRFAPCTVAFSAFLSIGLDTAIAETTGGVVLHRC